MIKEAKGSGRAPTKGRTHRHRPRHANLLTGHALSHSPMMMICFLAATTLASVDIHTKPSVRAYTTTINHAPTPPRACAHRARENRNHLALAKSKARYTH